MFGEADRAGFGDALETCCDVDAVAHQVAVGLLDHVAEMDADAELDAAIFRHAGVALDHAGLHFDRAPHRVDHAAKFGEESVAGALDDPPFVNGDGRIDQVAAQRPQSGERAILVSRGETAESNHIGGEDRRDLPIFAHGAPSPAIQDSTGKA